MRKKVIYISKIAEEQTKNCYIHSKNETKNWLKKWNKKLQKKNMISFYYLNGDFKVFDAAHLSLSSTVLSPIDMLRWNFK